MSLVNKFRARWFVSRGFALNPDICTVPVNLSAIKFLYRSFNKQLNGQRPKESRSKSYDAPKPGGNSRLSPGSHRNSRPAQNNTNGSNTPKLRLQPEPELPLTVRKIQKLVPLQGLIDVIQLDGSFQHRVSLTSVLKGLDLTTHRILIVDVQPSSDPRNEPTTTSAFQSTEEPDPIVTCKIITGPQADDSKIRETSSKKSKHLKAKTPGPKTVTMGWKIALNDLNNQKRNAIAKLLLKGHPVQIVLTTAREDLRRTPSELEMEKRVLLVKLCAEICEEHGISSKPMEGSIHSRDLTMFYRPKPTSS